VPHNFDRHGSKGAAPHPDLVIAWFSERQHGVMTRRQLLAAGVSDREIRRRVAIKRIRRVHDGVYEIPRATRKQIALFTAAVLACGDGAVLSHRSAAAHWGLRPQSTGPVTVSVPRRARQRAGLRIYEARLDVRDLAQQGGLPCTTVARTLIDSAAERTAQDLKRMLERAQILRIFDKREFDDALTRANGRRGVGTLRELLAALTDDVPPTRSELERRFLDLIAAASLPSPIANGTVCGHEVDFHWPHARLVVETDGAETHATLTAFHRDRERDLDLQLHGWDVIRITWGQLVDEPERVIALLRGRL
jgi:hypothetical protein